MNERYETKEPAREEVDRLVGPALIEIGSPGCGYCRAAQPLLAAALADYPHVRHLKIADARGRRLGRSYGVKLWPTLIFLCNGAEVARLVRPGDAGQIRDALSKIVECPHPVDRGHAP
jgi:thioredoxin 1